MATRRKEYTEDGLPASTTNGPPASTTTPTTPPRAPNSTTRSPFLPTRLEAQLLSIYPLTLLLGSIFSTLSPSTRRAPYSSTSQSHPPEFAPSYFAHKKNAFNVYFVKKGWFWTTLAFLIFWAFNPGLGRGFASRRRVQALGRFAVVTAVWVAMTQWFFGAPLIDRGFRVTGGQCEMLGDAAARAEMGEKRVLVTAAACKAVGGEWKGGHDISGHVFLLILGSALLWSEFLPALTRVEGLRDGRRIMLSDGKVASVAVEKDSDGDVGETSEATTQGVKFSLGVAALMWWMLLMTAAYFHTWFEKFTGLLVAFAALAVVYFLPRGVPALRAVLGMPGV